MPDAIKKAKLDIEALFAEIKNRLQGIPGAAKLYDGETLEDMLQQTFEKHSDCFPEGELDFSQYSFFNRLIAQNMRNLIYNALRRVFRHDELLRKYGGEVRFGDHPADPLLCAIGRDDLSLLIKVLGCEHDHLCVDLLLLVANAYGCPSPEDDEPRVDYKDNIRLAKLLGVSVTEIKNAKRRIERTARLALPDRIPSRRSDDCEET